MLQVEVGVTINALSGAILVSLTHSVTSAITKQWHVSVVTGTLLLVVYLVVNLLTSTVIQNTILTQEVLLVLGVHHLLKVVLSVVQVMQLVAAMVTHYSQAVQDSLVVQRDQIVGEVSVLVV